MDRMSMPWLAAEGTSLLMHTLNITLFLCVVYGGKKHKSKTVVGEGRMKPPLFQLGTYPYIY